MHCDFSRPHWEVLIFSFSQMTKLSMPVLWCPILLFILLYVSTLVQVIGDLYHVTVYRQGPESDGFVILATHVISTRHQSATLSIAPPPPNSNPLWTDTERVCYRETKISVLCRYIFNSQDQSRRGKRAANKHPLFSLKQDGICCCARLQALMSSSWFILSVTSWPVFPNSFIGRCTPSRALILFHCHLHIPTPFAQTQT